MRVLNSTSGSPEWGRNCHWLRNRAVSFVVTSNVDGQFQKAGYPEERILEVHGSIHWLQCTTPCSRRIWANQEEIPVNQETMRARAIPAATV